MEMSEKSKRNSRLIAGCISVLAAWLVFRLTYDPQGGFVFPPSQFYTWPIAVMGGILAGYSVSEIIFDTTWDLSRFAFGFIGGLIGWVGSHLLQEIERVELGEPLVASAFIGALPYGIALIIVGIVILEGATRFKKSI